MQNHLDAIIIMMRTTVNLPDDVYEAARSVAASKRLSLGEALAHLVRQGLNPPVEIDAEKAFPSFVVPSDAEPITLQQILPAEDEI